MTCCAYCGAQGVKLEREHAIPSCLYPKSRGASRVQRITVLSCEVLSAFGYQITDSGVLQEA